MSLIIYTSYTKWCQSNHVTKHLHLLHQVVPKQSCHQSFTPPTPSGAKVSMSLIIYTSYTKWCQSNHVNDHLHLLHQVVPKQSCHQSFTPPTPSGAKVIMLTIIYTFYTKWCQSDHLHLLHKVVPKWSFTHPTPSGAKVIWSLYSFQPNNKATSNIPRGFYYSCLNVKWGMVPFTFNRMLEIYISSGILTTG